MKKLMMMAVMFVASATAFAGDSDALKAILKAKTYAEAESLVKSSLDQLASAAEKAKAYNKLVDLAMADFESQSAIVTENQVNKQMGKEEKPVDQNLMVESAYNALQNGIECDKYDQQPNEKGKVKPAFADKNAQRLFTQPRFTLVNAGQDAAQNRDNAKARKYWELFVLSDAAPLFANCDRTQQKEFFGQVARFAAVYAYQDKDMDKALQLCDIAMKDPQEYEGCLNLKLEILGDGLKTRQDSLDYCNKLKDLYAEHKTDGVMEKLYNTLSGIGEKDAAFKVLDDALAENPNNFVALADKGLGLMQEQKAAEAATYLKKACELKPDNAALQTYAGTALSVQAQETEDPNAKKALYQEAIKYYDKAKELDPDRLQSNWGYNRYNAYYNLYGEDAPETKQAEEDSK
jgi:tetratricopeptide (TPR) repeat protein